MTLEELAGIVAPASERELCDPEEWEQAREAARAVLLRVAEWLELRVTERLERGNYIADDIADDLRRIASEHDGGR